MAVPRRWFVAGGLLGTVSLIAPSSPSGGTGAPLSLHFRQREGQTTVSDHLGRRYDSRSYLVAPQQPVPTGDRQELSLEFYATGYFTPDNLGHFAIGLRGDASADVTGDGRPDVRGRGVVLGNVSDYPRQPNHPHCGPAHDANSLVFESFWAAGNCVYGPSVPVGGHPVLRNGVWYRLTLWSGPACSNRSTRLAMGYTLWQQARNARTRWQRVASHQVLDDARNTSPASLDGWFIGEVFSRHDWSLRMRNIQVRLRPQAGCD